MHRHETTHVFALAIVVYGCLQALEVYTPVYTYRCPAWVIGDSPGVDFGASRLRARRRSFAGRHPQFAREPCNLDGELVALALCLHKLDAHRSHLLWVHPCVVPVRYGFAQLV